jgi:hypothetical protein
MIDVMFYVACGLLIYIHKHGDEFRISKPSFWGTVFGWPVVATLMAIDIWQEILDSSKNKK